MRAGEAKLRERVRDDTFSLLAARMARCAAAPPVALDVCPAVSDDSLQGFKENVHLWDDSPQGHKKSIDILDDCLQLFKEHV